MKAAALPALALLLACTPPDAASERTSFIKLQITKPTTGHTATVTLPVRSSGSTRVEDDASHLAIAFRLQNVGDVPATVSSSFVRYPNVRKGVDVEQRVRFDGTEDFVYFDSRPAAESLVYDIDVSQVSGLRLLGNTLEMLDVAGTPRLRVAPPYVVDAHEVKHAAHLSVFGCAFDKSAAPPWNRSITAPNATACSMRVTWEQVDYPARVDPAWTTTGSMANARNPTSTLLNTGKVLVAGGALNVAQAELYDPGSGTFATTGSMTTWRAFHTASILQSGEVLIAGGSNGSELATAELYDPNSGNFTATTGSLGVARSSASATLLSSGKVLFVGGQGTSGVTASAELFDPSTTTFSPTGTMSTKRFAHSATLLSSGKVLVVGGASSVSTYESTAELYDPSAGTFTFTKGAMAATRLNQGAALLPSGKVLIAGGFDGNIFLYSLTAELYDPTTDTFTPTGQMQTVRAAPALTLPSGHVLVAGGETTGSNYLSSSELYDPATGSFDTFVSMTTARLTALVLLPDGRVLAAGGTINGDIGTNTAEILKAVPDGKTCAGTADCESGNCVDGYCCDTACAGQCEACDVTGFEGTCKGFAGAPHGGRTSCFAAASTCGGVCDSSNRTQCSFPSQATVCNRTCTGDAQETDDTCDGNGTCLPALPHKCAGNFACADPTQCKTSCVTNADCAKGFVCGGGSCAPATSTCLDDVTSTSGTNQTQSCLPYKCDTDNSGTCKVTCASVDDCASPAVCDSSGHCVAPPSASTGCATSESPADLWWLVLGIGGVALRQRKRD